MNKDMGMRYGSDYHYLPVTSIKSGDGQEAASDLLSLTVQIVNVCFLGDPIRGSWVLVDAGMPHCADAIITAAENRFGANRPPQGIVLTHGHFDHVGAIIELVRYWDVQVFAHERELPYLTGKKAYLPPDPTVEGGLLAKMSFLYPNEPIDIRGCVRAISPGGTIPILPDWRWIHTPGHTPGHISLFRDSDRLLIAGDAFVTVNQESVYKVFMQESEISGPPKYFTTDWVAAKDSVLKLEALRPAIAVTGHGPLMSGESLSNSLTRLANEFDKIAVPQSGRYVH
jgi:glyoxylase-like metal-dependent hydrolase (beta-lactamase superfamily II)